MVGDSLVMLLVLLLGLPIYPRVLTGQLDVTGWLFALSTLLLLAPLIIRRRHPVLAAYLILLGALVHLADVPARAAPDLDPLMLRAEDIGLTMLLYTLVAYVGRRRAAEYAACLVVLCILWIFFRFDEAAVGPLVFIAIILAFSWVLGEFVGARRAYQSEVEQRLRMAETERDQHARIALVEERSRIARELHDVVAHSVSVMVVHADGAGYAVRGKPELAEDALRTISGTGREALAELRRLLEVLRSDDPETDRDLAPQPTARSLAELAEKVRSVGLPVQLDLHGAVADLPTGLGLAIYRITQEALTNTVKHAGHGAAARVRVARTNNEVTLEITDNGTGTARVTVPGGNGLIGMRERATVFGGTLEAGPGSTGGWRVHATIPIPSE
ncbi:signal transduction histidine kinase [Tamaricihabitans halophyticus]|uniref:histidine kinase n=2 Tax=Tamaricihabitans halophyticus TaxID=1262583 RepID=A0A4R2R3G3_9PSEU|nr:sensor histidine kinase [Tamaricihabitans halophyticus]TCP57360.1 signal transduction histidine kinase [Tamaricihabitans halophyticus]